MFTGSHLHALYKNGEAVFKSDNLSSISILKQVISRIATMSKVGLRVSISVNDETCPHYLRLIRPKFEFYSELRRKESLVNALAEIRAAEGGDVSFMNAEYKDILENAPRILEDYTKSNQLELLKTLVRQQLQCCSSFGSNVLINRFTRDDFEQLLEEFNWEKILKLFQV